MQDDRERTSEVEATPDVTRTNENSEAPGESPGTSEVEATPDADAPEDAEG